MTSNNCGLSDDRNGEGLQDVTRQNHRTTLKSKEYYKTLPKIPVQYTVDPTLPQKVLTLYFYHRYCKKKLFSSKEMVRKYKSDV